MLKEVTHRVKRQNYYIVLMKNYWVEEVTYLRWRRGERAKEHHSFI